MREILFRGKRLDNGEWVEGYVMIHDYDKATIFRQHQGDGSLEGFEADPETVCQYTGLTDKNGVKIFEGDIVKQYDLYNKVTCCGEVYWNTLFSAWHVGEIQTMFGDIARHEVIGNVFDNPELMEGGGADE